MSSRVEITLEFEQDNPTDADVKNYLRELLHDGYLRWDLITDTETILDAQTRPPPQEEQTMNERKPARIVVEYDDESLQEMTDADLTESELDKICQQFNNTDCSFIYEAIQDIVDEVVQQRENKSHG